MSQFEDLAVQANAFLVAKALMDAMQVRLDAAKVEVTFCTAQVASLQADLDAAKGAISVASK